ncbi:ABC transporter substrate-binding protein [Arcobacter aquimarinus]|uniref:ABC transporter substrate-binding protein n=1 Tax=Arcobacter aquimarinus TaxID=1315211 RepID=UPI003BB05002
MLKKSIFLLFTIFIFTSCSIQENKKLKIATTSWIGYTPLLYAQEKGWLEPLNIKLLNVVSLSESMYLYKGNNADVYMGTQYEYNFLAQKIESLIPIMLMNKSNGGDLVMSNFSVDELQKTEQEIDVYLEMDSINSILFEVFIKKYNLENKQINYINKDQAYISELKNINKATIIVTYVPYNKILEKNGFKSLETTKNNYDLLVIDGMITTKETLNENKKTFLELKKLINKAIENLQNDPKEYYETIKDYLIDTNYEEFSESLNDIIWINKNIPEKIIENLSNKNFPTRDLIK